MIVDIQLISASVTMLRYLLILILAMAPSIALSDTLTITSSADNTLFGEFPGYSNGAGDYIFTGLTRIGETRRALIAFDLAGSLPAGSTINSVSLTLVMNRAKGNTTVDVSLHRLTRSWGEGTSHADAEEGKGIDATANDATWSHAIWPGQTWTTAGGITAPPSRPPPRSPKTVPTPGPALK